MVAQLGSNAIRRNEHTRKVKSLILLLATLVATVTYQAGLHQPGGVWPDGLHAGEPILSTTQPSRYMVFIYCNSSAFMLSLDTIFVVMLNKEKIHTTLLVLVILDMVALMGAYAAGSWMDARSSIYVLAMAGGVIVYLTTHVLCVTLNPTDMDYRRLKKRHKRLVLVAIVIATITYQAGLNPPGGFRRHGRAAGAALLMDNYPRRFWVFFYCNTASLMASMALILFFLVSPNLDRLGIRCHALFYACIVLALLGVMAAYAAATVQRVQPHALFVFVLLAVVVSIVGVRTIQSRAFLLKMEDRDEDDEDQFQDAVFGHSHVPIPPRTRPRHISRPRLRLRSAQDTKYREVYASHKHLMLLGILAASATYQAGESYCIIFFYVNITSFIASLFVVVLQLQQILHQTKCRGLLVKATKVALILDLLCILASYDAAVVGAAVFVVVLGLLICVAVMPYWARST